jgi:hypothetical protein
VFILIRHCTVNYQKYYTAASPETGPWITVFILDVHTLKYKKDC